MKRFVLITLAAFALLAGGAAVPAFASTPPSCYSGNNQNPVTQGCPIEATVVVGSSTTLTGIADFSFNNGTAVPAGTTATQTGAENYTVSSNDPSGYTLSMEADGGSAGTCNSDVPCFINQSAPSTSQIPDQGNLTVTETGTAPQTINTWVNPSSGLPQVTVVHATTGPSSDNYVENYALKIPGTAATGTYVGDVFYLAAGN